MIRDVIDVLQSLKKLSDNGLLESVLTGFASLSLAQKFTKGQRPDSTALTSGPTLTVNLDDSNDFTVTLDQAATLANPTITAAQVGQKGTITITEDATGGYALAYGSYWKAAEGASVDLKTDANAVNTIDYHVLATDLIRFNLTIGWGA